jgi:hypothetical protein
VPVAAARPPCHHTIGFASGNSRSGEVDAYPEFREIGKRMLTEWEQGALDITPTVTAKSRAGQTLKQPVGHNTPLSVVGTLNGLWRFSVFETPSTPYAQSRRLVDWTAQDRNG